MVAAIKLLHLLEAFSTPWFLFSAPSNHHLVFFLLEIFNNIIQYQFDGNTNDTLHLNILSKFLIYLGNSNLVYTIIRKRHVFHALANLPSDLHGISKCLNARKGSSRATASRIVPAAPLVSPRSETIAEAKASEAAATPSIQDVDESASDGETKSDIGESSMEGSKPAQPAEPGTLKVSLLDTPGTINELNILIAI